MKEKTKFVGVRLREDEWGIAHQIQKEMGLSLSEQIRNAYDFYIVVVFALAVEAIDEEQAIAVLREEASDIQRRYYRRDRPLERTLKGAAKHLSQAEKECAPRKILPSVAKFQRKKEKRE